MEMVNYKELIEVSKKISNPFSREIFIATIKEEFGEGFTVFYDMGNGIAVFIRSYMPKKDMVLFEESEVAGASLIYNLGSDINFVFRDKQEHLLKQGDFLMGLSSNKFYVEVPLKKNKQLITVTIGMKEELFLHVAHPIKNIKELMNQALNRSYTLVHTQTIDACQFELLDFFKELTSYEDTLKNIFLESKTTDLLHYSIKKIAHFLNHSTHTLLEKGRIISLERAKEIIQKEYHTPLCIKEIAYKSATNECYLKKDFKKYYGMTILEMLQKRRLEIAKQLLKKGFGIKEVAQKVGYKHTGNFSKLFLHHFHMTPYEYKKQFA